MENPNTLERTLVFKAVQEHKFKINKSRVVQDIHNKAQDWLLYKGEELKLDETLENAGII